MRTSTKRLALLSTASAAAAAFLLTGTAAAQSVTCGNVSTTSSASPAVVIAANGDTNVTCGTVTTTGAGSDGITVSNLSGTTTVTGGTTAVSGLGSRGIVVTSSAATTAATATTPATNGAVVVNTGVVISNGNAVVATSTGAGSNVTVNATGNVTSTTGTGITSTAPGTATVVIGAGTTTTGVQGVALNGTTANVLTVNGNLRNTAGTTTPYTLSGTGPFSLNLGTAGVITGPLMFTTGADTFNNAGTFAVPVTLDFLAGSDALNNTGTLTAFTGNSAVNSLERFNNTGGLIDLRDGAANDVLTLTNSNYAATGNARLSVDVVGTSGVNTADHLVIGGTTTGTTSVLARFTNPVVNTTGALVVDSTLNNLTAGQFVFGGTTSQGLINYAVQVRGGDAFIVSTLDARAYDAVFLGRQTQELWYKSADAYTAYATARRVDFGHARENPVGIWAQLYRDTERRGNRNATTTAFGTSINVNDRIKNEFRGAQVGLDFGAPNFVVGVTGGYEHAKADSAAGTSLDTEGYNYGAYAQFGMTSGIYGGLLAKRDVYKSRMTNGGLGVLTVRPHARSTGAEAELGFRTGGAGNVNFDVGAGLSYVRSNLDTFNFGYVTFDADRMTSVRGRVHARASFAGTLAPFVEVRGFHEFRAGTDYRLVSGTNVSSFGGIGGNAKDTWARVEAGIGGGVGGGPLISAWADLGDVRGYGVRAGFRF